MVRHRLVSGLPEPLAPLPRSPAPPYTPCVEGRQRAAPHSSSFPPTTAPFQTLHLDVWGPSPVLGPHQERYFLIVVDDYSRYTTVLPLRRKADVPTVLEPWLLARGDAQALCGPCLHSERGVRYAAHQLNLWPSDTWPRVAPVSLWTGSSSVAADYRVWGSLAHVHAPGENKLSARTRACFFLGFPLDTSGWQFFDPITNQIFSSQDVTFNESFSYYRSRPHSGSETFSPLMFLTTDPPPSRPGSPSLLASYPVKCVAHHSAVVPHAASNPSHVWGCGRCSCKGEGTGAAGAGGVGSRGAGGVGVEVTPMEDTAASSRRPCPASPPGFTSVPQFPPCSSLRPVAVEPGGVPTRGNGGPKGVGGGGAGSGAAAAAGEGRGGATGAAAGAGNLAADTRGGGAAGTATTRPARPSTCALGSWCQRSTSDPRLILGKGYTLVVLGGYGRTDPLLNKPFYPSGLVTGILTCGPLPSPPVPPVQSLFSSQWTRHSPLSCVVSPEPRHSRYRADGLFHLVLRSRVPPPPVLPQPPESSLTVLHDPLSNYLRASRPVVSRVLSALVTHPTAPLSSVSALVTTVAGFSSSHHLDYASHLMSGTAHRSTAGCPCFYPG
ncbi:unnamed protein product, partial [Closterium sp. NIES-53]